MKEKITQLSRERFEYELPKIICSEDKLEIEVETGRIVKGTFTIKNTEGRHMKGLLYSSSHLLRLTETSFVGTEAVVEYIFHAEDIRAKDKINGIISIVSSCGEKELPFEIVVTEKCIEASFGEVRDLFHYANLAKINWSHAVSIFKSPDFAEIFLKKDVENLNLYNGLVKSGKYNQALEEFLVCIQKKDQIELSLSKDTASYQVKKENISDSFFVKKNTWGYLDAKVTSNQEFLQVERGNIGAADFIGASCEITYSIKNEKLRAGKNYAKITIENVCQKLEYIVEVEKIVKHMERDYDEKKIKRCEIVLVNNYINFRSNRIAVSDYVQEMQNVLTKLEGMIAVKRNLGELGYSRRLDLYQMHLKMVAGDNAGAKEILDSLENEEHILKKNTIVDYCGYLYLKVLFTRKDSDLQYALREIRDCYKQSKSEWALLWFLLFLDEKYEQEPKEKLMAIEEQFALGCTSPVLYYEVCNIINQDPTLMIELTPCTIQAMHMGVKMWLFSETVAVQYAYLAERMKMYHRLVLFDLVTFYDRYKNKDVLTAICSMLIKADRSDQSCFAWYELGIKEQLRLTQLYEYYMYSIDDAYAGLLPQEVYLYFSYNTNLLEDKKAFLFANIVEHKDELTDIYPVYIEQMRSYMLSQLQKHRIDYHLAVLYRAFLPEIGVSSSIAQDLPYVLFKQRVVCKHPDMVGVVVLHKESEQEVYTPLDKDGNAYVDIFTEKAKVFIVDASGRRYEKSVPWSIEKLLKRDVLAEQCFSYNPSNRMVCMYIYERIEYYHKRNIPITKLQKYMDTAWMKPEYGKKWIMNLIQNYYDNYEGEALEALLLEIDLHGMRSSDRNLIIEYCIIRGLYDLAYKQIKEYSFEGVSVKRLRAICSKMIKKIGMETEDTLLANMAFYVFRAGKYDEIILKYLVQYYLGTTKDMFLVWKEAKEYDLDTIALEERLLGQILFAESYVQDAMAVFMSFYNAGRNRTLIKAFVSYYCYKYLVRDRVVDESFFEIVKKELLIEENKTELYALLKYYSTLEEWNNEQETFIQAAVERLIQEGIIFPFFKVFTKKMRFPGGIEHMNFVEYKTNPANQVILHYFIEDEEMGDGFSEIEMQNMYQGIFVAHFMLFQNETLQYYVEEINGEEEPIITESITVKGDDKTDVEDEDTFGQINMMLVAREMKDEKTLLTLIKSYEKNQYVLRTGFKMLE